MSEIKLDVSGMTCGSCVKHVTNVLKPLDGVEDVSVDLATGKVKVTRATDKADDLIAALIEDGYPAKLDSGGVPQVKQGGGCSCSQHDLTNQLETQLGILSSSRFSPKL